MSLHVFHYMIGLFHTPCNVFHPIQLSTENICDYPTNFELKHSSKALLGTIKGQYLHFY